MLGTVVDFVGSSSGDAVVYVVKVYLSSDSD